MFGVLGLIRFFFLKKLLGLQYYYNDLPQILIKQPLFVSLQGKKKKRYLLVKFYFLKMQIFQ